MYRNIYISYMSSKSTIPSISVTFALYMFSVLNKASILGVATKSLQHLSPKHKCDLNSKVADITGSRQDVSTLFRSPKSSE